MRDRGPPAEWLAPAAPPDHSTPPAPAAPAVRPAPGATAPGAAAPAGEPSSEAPPLRPWWTGRSWRTGRWVLAGAVAVALGLLVANRWSSRRPAISAKAVNSIVDQKVNSAISQLQAQPPAAAQVYRAVRAGLVLIESQPSAAPGAEDLGTGIIVNNQGDILTSLHVVQGGSAIKVTFADGTASAASIKSSDPAHDTAVLTAARLPSVVVPEVLGGGAQIGDETFAVGNPLGLVGSLSAGVVSGLDRSFPLANGRTLSGMIQFDAAVNPGSSGGPLLNTKGQVIGIVTGLANAEGAKEFAGIGFAVPIATAGGAAGAPAK